VIAQMEIVVRMEFEPFVEPIFCEDSYGYIFVLAMVLIITGANKSKKN